MTTKRPFASRLALRVPDVTVDVIETLDDGYFTASTVYADLVADGHQQIEAQEQTGPFNEVSTVIQDLFIFSQQSDGTLPAILEKHTIQWGGTDYNVIRAVNQAGMDERLHVYTRRAR